VIDKDNTTIIDGAGTKKVLSRPRHRDPQAGRGHHLDYDREAPGRLAKPSAASRW
jgi:hypothetical protein